MLETSFASVMGSRSMTRQMPLPTSRRSVAAAAEVSATNRSSVCEYSRGSSGPPGQGDLRLAGMCVCSGKKSDSKPCASASRASSPGAMA